MTMWRMDQSLKDVTFKYRGDDVTITIKPVTWSKKNQIISKCMNYSTDGRVVFNMDEYCKEMLSVMIVKAPWGETNRIFLSAIDDELGSRLQKILPTPFEGADDMDFFGEESETPSMEEAT